MECYWRNWFCDRGFRVKMLLPSFIFLAFLATGCFTLSNLPCWDQEQCQYLAVTKGSYIPISEINLCLKGAGQLEIRKPTLENTKVSCFEFDVDGNRHNQRTLRRLIHSFHLVSEVRSITSFWPKVRVCANVALAAEGAFAHELPGFTPECSHVLLLSRITTNDKYPLFVSNLNALKGKRLIIETFYNYYLNALGLKPNDHLVQLVDPTILQTGETEINRHIKFRHQKTVLNLPLAMDMYLTSGIAEHSYGFAVDPSTDSIHLMYHVNKMPDYCVDFARHLVVGFMVATEPFLKTNLVEAFDVYSVMTRALNIDSFDVIEPKPELHNLAMAQVSILNLTIYRSLKLQILLYIYLTLASGPFFKSIYALRINSRHDRVDLRVIVSKSHETAIIRFFNRIAIVSFGSASYSLALVPENGPVVVQDYDPSVAEAFGETIRRHYRTVVETFNSYWGEDGNTSQLEILVKYGLVKCPIGKDYHEILGNKDRKFLGLPLVNTSSHPYTGSSRIKRLKSRHDDAPSTADIGDSQSASEDLDDEEELVGVSLEDAFAADAKQLSQAKINTAIIRNELESIRNQCKHCERFILDSRHLVIFELFLKIKGIISTNLSPNVSIFQELRNDNSLVCQKLNAVSVPGIVETLQRALEILSKERQKVAKPFYAGENLYWITSEDLRSAFISLLPFYQYPSYPVPPEESIPEISVQETPKDVSMGHVLAMKQHRLEAEDELKTMEQKLKSSRKQSKACLDAYKKREILWVGTVFKSFIDDLKNLVPGRDIIEEAQESTSPIYSRMETVGIKSISQLKKIYAFVLTHRNSVAHPSGPLPDDEISKRINPSLLRDYRYLLQHFRTLQEAFKNDTVHAT